tara:strand:- start:12104 stop:13201 length:1098 start_codon:yes stop_codon:yes gene_type:complete
MKTTKNLHWFSPNFNNEEKKSVNIAINRNFLNEGEITKEFEKKISDFLNVKYAIATTSGTTAISLSLMSLGIGKGDEVIIPNFTFVATANAVILTGATVKLVDVKLDDLTIDVERIEKEISRKTKAIVTVDVNGRSCDYNAIKKICRKFNLKLVCDSAEALGSSINGKYLGTQGDCGCFSFSAAKTLSTGQGGMIVTNNKKIKNRILELKDQGRKKRGTGGKDSHPALGFNFKYTDLQASIGIKQLEKIEIRIKNFKKRDYLYRKFLGKTNLCLPELNPNEVLQWFDIIFENENQKKSVIYEFKKKKIGFREFWNPVNHHNFYKKLNCEGNNNIKISKLGIWLPSNFAIQYRDIEYICKTIKKIL